MKTRILHISVAFLLLISTLGVTINMHFCGNRLISSSVFSAPDACCNGNCGKCHNESQNIRITDAFESAFSNDIVKNPYVFHFTFNYSHFPLSLNTDINNQFVVEISPNISPHEIVKSATLLQNFRL